MVPDPEPIASTSVARNRLPQHVRNPGMLLT